MDRVVRMLAEELSRKGGKLTQVRFEYILGNGTSAELTATEHSDGKWRLYDSAENEVILEWM